MPKPVNGDDIYAVVVPVGHVACREDESGVELIAEGFAQSDQVAGVLPVDRAGGLNLEAGDRKSVV